MKKLKLNADNLAVCLHSLLKRIEQLEGSAGHDKSNGTASDINISPSKSIDEALGALLAEETESAVNGPKSDVKVRNFALCVLFSLIFFQFLWPRALWLLDSSTVFF